MNSIPSNVPSEKVLSQMIFNGDPNRLMVIVDIPNRKKLLDRLYLRFCDAQAFFRSSGTSNHWSFESVFLPFSRVDSNNWIHKIGSHGQEDWLLALLTVCQKENGKLTAKQKNMLVHFLTRFGTWWMLQISAGLGGKLWDEIKLLSWLKFFILSHVWNGREYKKSDKVIRVYQYNEQDAPVVDRETVNNTLREYRAMCGKDEDSKTEQKTTKKKEVVDLNLYDLNA